MAYFQEEEENVDYIGFNDADDDDEEQYDDSEFERYSEEEMADKWGSMSFDELISEFDRIVSSSKKFFFSKRKRIVDGQELSNLVDVVNKQLPGEIKTSRDIINSRDDIIANAKRSADSIRASADEYSQATTAAANDRANQIVAKAQQQAEELVSSHSITQQAREKAEQIIADANRRAQEQMAATKKACEDHIALTMKWAQAAMSGSNEYALSLMSAVKNVMMQNVKDIDGVAKRYSADYEKKLNEIKRGPDFRAAARAKAQHSQTAGQNPTANQHPNQE